MAMNRYLCRVVSAAIALAIIFLAISVLFLMLNEIGYDAATFLEAVRAADASTVQEYLTAMPRGVRDELRRATPSPVYYLTEMSSDASVAAQRTKELVLEAFLDHNTDASRLYHPLTSAYRHDKKDIATALLLHSTASSSASMRKELVREVYASQLSCNMITAIDNTVSVVIEDGETRGCAVHHPRVVKYRNSQLHALYVQYHHGMIQPPLSSELKGNSINSRLHANDGRAGVRPTDPFSGPPPHGLLPPRALVMHPAAFEDFSEAIAYYLIGTPMGPTQFVFFLIAQIPSLLVTCLIVVRYVYERFFQPIEVAPEQETGATAVREEAAAAAAAAPANAIDAAA